MPYSINLTEEEEKVLLKAEYGMPMTDEQRKLLRKILARIRELQNPSKH